MTRVGSQRHSKKIYIYICVCVCVCVYIYICVCVCVYVYVCAHKAASKCISSNQISEILIQQLIIFSVRLYLSPVTGGRCVANGSQNYHLFSCTMINMLFISDLIKF